MIYFDNAATTMIKPKEVIEAIIEAMGNLGNSGRGLNEASSISNKKIFEARENIADFFGIKNSSRLAFTSNSTEALNIAIKGIMKEKEHIITTVMEHNSVLRPIYELGEKGVEYTIVECNNDYRFDYEQFEKVIKENTKAIVCTHSANLTGDIIDIEKISQICKKHNLIFILDASQSSGILPIDVEKLGIDVLCFTGHKSLFGPQGTGGIYVKEGIEIKPLKSGGTGIMTFSKEQPRQMPELLEAGTLNGHGIMGLNAGVNFIKKIGIDTIREKEEKLMMRFYDGIKELKNIKIYGNFENSKRTPIVAFNIGDYDSNDVAEELSNMADIACRAGGHCAPLFHQYLGTVQQGIVRFSFSYFNTEEEVDKSIEILRELCEF